MHVNVRRIFIVKGCFFKNWRYILNMMKTVNILKISFMFLFVLIAASLALEAEETYTAELTTLDGEAEVRTIEGEKWVPLKSNTLLNEGDIIQTLEGSSAVIELKGKELVATAAVEEFTQLMFLNLSVTEDMPRVILDMAVGKITVTTFKTEDGKAVLQIKTPATAINIDEDSIVPIEVEASE